VPNSINSLIDAKLADPFVPVTEIIKRDPKEIYDFLRLNLNDNVLNKLLENSYYYYKCDILNSKDLIKNTLSLLLDYILDKVKNSSIEEEKKHDILDFCRNYFRIFSSQSEVFCDLLDFLGKKQVILEPKEIIIIILGYATGTFKKIYSN
jgi:hypothetical protein